MPQPHPEQSNLPFLKDNTPETKRCTKCGEEKELDQFYFIKKGSPGRRPECKDCKKLYNKRYTKANEERIKNGTQEEWIKSFYPDGTKRCSQCKVVRDLSDFGVDNNNKFGVMCSCKGCDGFASARGTGRKKPHKPMKMTREEYLDIYYRDNCRGCNNPNPRGVDRIDSSKPYTIENTQELCGYCNKAKLDRTMSEWLDHTRQIVEHQEKLR
tara:strand:+ start:135 stop:770 length:636 start_codon:yes stop_codon:yes gene_type:complete